MLQRNRNQRKTNILVIYGEEHSGVKALPHYEPQGYSAIIHREAQFFEGPEPHVSAFAIESMHSDTILMIREAYEGTGVKEVSRNMPVGESTQSGGESDDQPPQSTTTGDEEPRVVVENAFAPAVSKKSGTRRR